jgi:membrane protein implicated in regulation of membrane protease activity
MSGSIMLWIIVAAAAVAVDLITSAFLFVWFAVGSIAAIIALILNYSFTIQIMVFIGVSAVSMLIGYPMIKKTIKNTVQKTKTMEEGYIGRVITISEDVSGSGHIIDGIYWLAKTADSLKKGEKAKITGIEGNKIVIERYYE